MDWSSVPLVLCMHMSAKNRYLEYRQVIISHRIVSDIIWYPCPRYILLANTLSNTTNYIYCKYGIIRLRGTESFWPRAICVMYVWVQRADNNSNIQLSNYIQHSITSNIQLSNYIHRLLWSVISYSCPQIPALGKYIILYNHVSYKHNILGLNWHQESHSGQVPGHNLYEPAWSSW